MIKVYCMVCVPGSIFEPMVAEGATDRQKIAALCNHVMEVHGGGGRDAWEQACLAFPLAAIEWEREVLAESH